MSEFDRIIGYDDVKLELIRFCDVFRNPDKYRELGVAVPSGILLHGEPGVFFMVYYQKNIFIWPMHL